jgi:heme/copper-type cytochrome/quinol oxidase subunit 4
MSKIFNDMTENKNTNLTVSEILFGALLAIVAVSSIWLSSSLMLHLFNNL